jgi:hypothetical protein
VLEKSCLNVVRRLTWSTTTHISSTGDHATRCHRLRTRIGATAGRHDARQQCLVQAIAEMIFVPPLIGSHRTGLVGVRGVAT